MSPFLLQMSIMLLCAIVAGLVGFGLSRRHFRGEIEYQARVFTTEMARLRRQASTAEAARRTLKQEVDRLRRRAR